MKPVLIINGVDFTPFLTEDSIRWTRNDLDSDSSGRTLDGVMHRSRVAMKRKLEINNLKRLTVQQMRLLNAALMPQTISVTFIDPIIGGVYQGTFYGSSVQATTQYYDESTDDIYWHDVSFNIIEV